MRIAIFVVLVLCAFGASAAAADFASDGIQVVGTGPIGGRIVAAPASVTATLVQAYSNFTNEAAWGQSNGGAGLVGAGTITRLMADDIVPSGDFAGADVLQIKFAVGNFNDVPVTCRMRFRFYAADGPGGGPGTYLWGFDGNGRTFNALTVYLFTKTLAAGQFKMPGTTFWAGIAFDDVDGTSGATAAQLNLMDQIGFGPATVGSSSDEAFLSSAPGTFDSGFPAGSFFSSIGCVCPPNPPPAAASFGWEFDVDLATPALDVTWGRIKSLYR